MLTALAALLAAAAQPGLPPMKDPPSPSDPALAVVAESSNYTATSLHAQVTAQLDAIAKASPRARRISMGKTGEGRDIPMVIIADPPIATAEQARAAAEHGRTLVLLFGNIHAGECDGKEALGILARELATNPGHPLLKHLVVAIAPNYNADGNERVGPTANRRPGQLGPEKGCGTRENAAGLDLNRDFIKLEAPETRALMGFLNAWDPAVVVDCHTTDGSFHRYLVTTAGPKSPATDPALLDFARGTYFPALFEKFHADTGRHAFWYGNFEGAFGEADRGHARWETFPAEARYGTTAIGLRGRLSVLVESYSYAPYRDRVLGSLAFCRAILELADAHRDAIRALARRDDHPAEVALRSKAAPREGTVTILGERETTANGRSTSTGEPAEYQAALWDRFEATVTTTAPEAYAIRNPSAKVVDTLEAHGLTVARTTEDTDIDAEVQTITRADSASRAFQGHALVTLDTTTRRERTHLPAGTLIIPARQPLARLAVYLLEPRSEDGLATWNFFDEASRVGAEFPVLRLTATPPAAAPAPGPPAAPSPPPTDPRREPPASPHLE